MKKPETQVIADVFTPHNTTEFVVLSIVIGVIVVLLGGWFLWIKFSNKQKSPVLIQMEILLIQFESIASGQKTLLATTNELVKSTALLQKETSNRNAELQEFKNEVRYSLKSLSESWDKTGKGLEKIVDKFDVNLTRIHDRIDRNI